MLADRHDEPGQSAPRSSADCTALLLELVPGGARRFLCAQARALITTVKPQDPAGKTHRPLAAELAGELEAIDKKTRALDKEFTEPVAARRSTLVAPENRG